MRAAKASVKHKKVNGESVEFYSVATHFIVTDSNKDPLRRNPVSEISLHPRSSSRRMLSNLEYLVFFAVLVSDRVQCFMTDDDFFLLHTPTVTVLNITFI